MSSNYNNLGRGLIIMPRVRWVEAYERLEL